MRAYENTTVGFKRVVISRIWKQNGLSFVTELQKDSKLPIKSNSKPSKTLSAENLKIGDPVFVTSLGLEGKVSSLPNPKGDLTVLMGSLSSQVNIRDLEMVAEPSKTK